MTKAVCDRILKDANGHISDHLRSHIHLTNCIHLKNHMHKHSPVLADRSLMRDLVVLQRSRSLRDPSMSPPSWHSPSNAELILKERENDAVVGNARRSTDLDRRKSQRELSGDSLDRGSLPASRLAPAELSRPNDVTPVASNRKTKSGVRERRRVKNEGTGGTRPVNGNHVRGDDGLAHNNFSGNVAEMSNKIKNVGSSRQDDHPKTLSSQLLDVDMDSHGLTSSNAHRLGHTFDENIGDEAETSTRRGPNKVKRRRFRPAKRTRASAGQRDISEQNEISVASNSLAHSTTCPKYHKEQGDMFSEQNFTRAPKNGCGIPWNWSRIHHRGKTFLDRAGRSFSCGLSDTKLKRSGPVPRGREGAEMPVMSEHSSSFSRSDGEALPLLDASGSHENAGDAAWVHDYSGELGIFADNLLKHEIDSDLASEARSGDQHKFQGHRTGRHQNLTQKYMPRTFRDLVGQNLVAQALSNAVMRKKIGVLYVFYGPHGTGKTSCARIFARALNCQSIEHPKPCGFCNSCTAHNMGKSRNIREIGPVNNLDFESLMDVLENMIVCKLPSLHRVFIFDDCDTLSSECWSSILKVIDRAPRRVVFILVCATLDILPHIIISRCQKFFFPKLKDADIIHTLQLIAIKEDLEIDKDALKLIASRSDGSLRDAEMTLEQLSLLGQKVSVSLVQELVGLISDEKLVDLLDFALAADTVNTVKNLREIMESGVEPLALMSQLATVITDILAGSYDFTKEKSRRKFFKRQPLSKEDMEKLRQALKTLSEAEKQLRMSNDRLTWLTAALLQLAPDQQYMLPSSSAEMSIHDSPLGLSSAGERERMRSEQAEKDFTERRSSKNIKNHQAESSSNVYRNSKLKSRSTDKTEHAVVDKFHKWSSVPADISKVHLQGEFRKEVEEIWFAVLDKIQVESIKDFMFQEGKLISVTFGTAPTVQLMFNSHLMKCKAEKFGAHILQAFEAVLGHPVTIEIRCEPRKDVAATLPLTVPAPQNGSSQIYSNRGLLNSMGVVMGQSDCTKRTDQNGLNEPQLSQLGSSVRGGRDEIVEIKTSPREQKGMDQIDDNNRSEGRGKEIARLGREASNYKNSAISSRLEQRKFGEQTLSQSLVKSKVSLAHVIQQAEGCKQQNGWSKRKAVSIAEKLEQENLRLEPRSRNLLCWKASKATRRKLARMKIKTRRPQMLLKIVTCGKCLTMRSPR